MSESRFIDYEKFKIYHTELMKEITPKLMFSTIEELFTLSNWETRDVNSKTYVYGLKEGLMISVGNSIWQLVDSAKFSRLLTVIGVTAADKARIYNTADKCGWKAFNGGGNADSNVTDHVLNMN